MNNAKILVFFNKNKHYFLLIIIILIGFILRFYRFYEFSYFFGDYGRDILVASHIVKYKDFSLYGPVANYPLEIALRNSPFYYYFLAFFYCFLRTPKGIAILFCLFGAILIVLVYYLTSLLFNKQIGLYASFFTAISNNLVSYSRSVWQPHLIPFLSCLTILFFFLSYKKRNLIYLYLGFLFLFISLNLHLSSLIILPSYLVLIGYIIYKNFFKKRFLIPIAVFFVSVILWISIYFIFIYVKGSLNFSLSDLIINYFPRLLKNLSSFSLFNVPFNVPLNISFLNFISSLAVIVFLILVTMFNKMAAEKKSDFILTTLLLSIFLFGFLNMKIEKWYFSPFFIPWLLAWSQIIEKINMNRPKIFKFLIISFFSLFIGKGNEIYFIKQSSDEFKGINKIITAIAQDINKLKTNKFIIKLGNEDLLPWDDGAFWYVLEEKLNKKLVRLNGNFFEPIIDNPQHLYLICVSMAHYDVEQNCVKPFLFKYSQYYDPDYRWIFSEEENGVWTNSIFRLSIR